MLLSEYFGLGGLERAAVDVVPNGDVVLLLHSASDQAVNGMRMGVRNEGKTDMGRPETQATQKCGRVHGTMRNWGRDEATDNDSKWTRDVLIRGGGRGIWRTHPTTGRTIPPPKTKKHFRDIKMKV